MELTCECGHITRMPRRKFKPQCEICARNLTVQAEQAQSELEKLARMIQEGDACGHCRLELYEEDECFECNHEETRGRGKGRYTYECDHAYHASCIRQHYAVMYPPEVLQPNKSDDKWVAPDDWKCPSCVGCVWSRTRYANTPVFHCQHCLSSFGRKAARKAHLFCFFCKLNM